jgi:hypothetical protein
MITLQNATVGQLRKLVSIREEIESLKAQLEGLTGGESPALPAPRGRKKMSRAARAAMAAGQKARWARVKGTTDTPKPAKKKDGRSSPAFRAKMRAAAKARWAKVKTEGKTTL